MGSVSLSVRVRRGTIEYFASRVFMSHCLNFEDVRASLSYGGSVEHVERSS
jgi:hypothetical protein